MAPERRTFPAMGTEATLVVVGAPTGTAGAAADLVARCEQRWSRFRQGSELCRLNAAAGGWTRLEPGTYELVAAAVDAWWATAGRFDPTVLRAVEAAGYDRSYRTMAATAGGTLRSAPGCAGIELDPLLRAVRLPAGVALDLGGIAKGHTADLVVELVLAAGAEGALVDLGGDLRVAGRAPDPGGWGIAVDDPLTPGADLGHLALADGGVATSSTRRRRWHGPDGADRHHVLDPATGAPTAGLASATIVAANAATAEVVAKAALVAGAGAGALVSAAGLTGVLVRDDGTVVALPGMEAFGWT